MKHVCLLSLNIYDAANSLDLKHCDALFYLYHAQFKISHHTENNSKDPDYADAYSTVNNVYWGAIVARHPSGSVHAVTLYLSVASCIMERDLLVLVIW